MLEYQLYYIEQKLYNLIGLQIDSANPTIFLLLILSGLLTSMNPCLISIIPISISYIYTEKLENKNKQIFILGILTSTILSIIIFELVSKKYEYLFHIFPVLSYTILIIVSLNLLQILELNNNFLKINKFLKKISSTTLSYNYITGLMIGISSSSCTTPILLIILLWISSCKSWLLGSIYSITYLFSYTLPLYLIINNNFQYKTINQWSSIWNNFSLIGGSIMLGYSIFSFLNTIFT
uniref:Thiol:disulfide interchange protein n=1 Tax=Gracilaria vermiculophylla TaxID=2608709 RepID=A0A345U8P9_9FLOR|nr:thiol:disulfide interchange protein [Gracilaria vermiculophylla]AXI96835.1 thiol:disulfide interchange protein [Gracilaria vermiculophylla]QXU75049.1 thiol:disulfide interchange protein [Gracilaria vermiculophylla]WDZ67942.1 thiol:disulfide interchange protein [Gracilaria vermiculophylla]